MSRFIKTVYHYMYFGCAVHKKLCRFCNVEFFSARRKYAKEKIIQGVPGGMCQTSGDCSLN